MALVLAMLALARGAVVPPAGLATAVQSMRPRADEPIAIVTPNRSVEKRAVTILGESNDVFSRAGSASETDIAQLGVTCAVFLQRDGVSRSSPWIVIGVGDCTALSPPVETIPKSIESLEFKQRHRYVNGMTTATVGLLVMPPLAVGTVALGATIANSESEPVGATMLLLVGSFSALMAPAYVGAGSLAAGHALRKSGVDVSIVPGATSLTLIGLTILTPAFDAEAVGAVLYCGSFVAGGVQMAMDTAAYRGLDREPSHNARFHLTPVPLAVDGMRGLALTGTF
jgi:hypothetical protein